LTDIGRRHGEREARAEPHDALQLPAAEQVRGRTAAGQPPLALPERQLVATADRGSMTLIVPCGSLVGVQIPGERGVVRLDLTRPVVGAFRDLVVAKEVEAVRVALLRAEGEAVEAGPAGVGRIENRGLERRVWRLGLSRVSPG